MIEAVLKLGLPCGPAARELPGRNDPCACGSGRKWKKCCLSMQDDMLHQDVVAGRDEVADAESRMAEEAAKVR